MADSDRPKRVEMSKSPTWRGGKAREDALGPGLCVFNEIRGCVLRSLDAAETSLCATTHITDP